MPALHVYAIIPSSEALALDVPGVDGGEVRTIPHGDLAAVVGIAPVQAYHGLGREHLVRYLLAHQQVVESVMRRFPVLPVKFGTALSGEAQVQLLLAQGGNAFRSSLLELAGRMQMEVVILWNAQEVFREISLEPEIARLRSETASHTHAQAMADRIAVGRMVQQSLDRRRSELHDALLPDLRASALDAVVLPPMDDSMVANIALLVDEPGRATLEGQLETLDVRYDGRLGFKCVGPLPPYSFATVEVQPISRDAVEAARETLGLPEEVTFPQVKQAFRGLAGEASEVGGDPGVAEIAHAYKLLAVYIRNQMPDAADDQPCPLGSCDPDGALLIFIRRQDAQE